MSSPPSTTYYSATRWPPLPAPHPSPPIPPFQHDTTAFVPPPGYFSHKVELFLGRLLDRNPSTRLGSKGAEDIRKHLAWNFAHPPVATVDWAKMSRRKVGARHTPVHMRSG